MESYDGGHVRKAGLNPLKKSYGRLECRVRHLTTQMEKEGGERLCQVGIRDDRASITRKRKGRGRITYSKKRQEDGWIDLGRWMNENLQ